MNDILKVGVLVLGFLAMVAHADCISRNANIPLSKPNSIYINNGDGTITDTETGLMWKMCSQGQSGSNCTTGTAGTMKWSVALSAANNSTENGYSDWRLPNLNEMASLLEAACYNPSINTAMFPNLPNGEFWTSSVSAYRTNEAWSIGFFNGNDTEISVIKSDAKYVLLVRD